MSTPAKTSLALWRNAVAARGQLERAGHGRQVQEIEIAIVASDGDHEEADAENQAGRHQARHRDLRVLAVPKEQDHRNQRQGREQEMREDRRSCEPRHIEIEEAVRRSCAAPAPAHEEPLLDRPRPRRRDGRAEDRAAPGPSEIRAHVPSKPRHHRRMPTVVLAAPAVGQLHRRVIGHLARPIQGQNHRKSGCEQPLRQIFQEFTRAHARLGPPVAALLHIF